MAALNQSAYAGLIRHLILRSTFSPAGTSRARAFRALCRVAPEELANERNAYPVPQIGLFANRGVLHRKDFQQIHLVGALRNLDMISSSGDLLKPVPTSMRRRFQSVALLFENQRPDHLNRSHLSPLGTDTEECFRSMASAAHAPY
ncbi:hypothetical protein OCOJLMKI_4329 [Methylobacterium iners]|uniref:Uncharacterized protein n=1 Tax=Methylobacterium iners TaxID=418707 RepID=A0ABQ4S1V3_9HYPH|nr:hypothetical protein OCOJLMKI_4329 [Methylobacterium iners]